jgi:hypothetical protein
VNLEIPTPIALFVLLSLLALAAKFVGPRAGDAGVVSDSLFGSPTDLGWPKGVQEEDPQPWRIELLGLGRTMAREESAHTQLTPDTTPSPTKWPMQIVRDSIPPHRRSRWGARS